MVTRTITSSEIEVAQRLVDIVFQQSQQALINRDAQALSEILCTPNVQVLVDLFKHEAGMPEKSTNKEVYARAKRIIDSLLDSGRGR